MSPQSGLEEDFGARKPDALERAYAAHARVLYAVARNVLGDHGLAQDCVHDALLRVWQSPDSYRPDRGALRPFLVACVRNEALTALRSAGRRSAREEMVDRLEPHETTFEVVDHVEAERVRRALQLLPHEQRAALQLIYYGNRTQAQAAEELGVPLGTLKSRIALAMRRLGAALSVASTGKP